MRDSVRPKRRDVIHIFGHIDAAELGVEVFNLSLRFRSESMQLAADFQVCFPNLLDQKALGLVLQATTRNSDVCWSQDFDNAL